MLHTGEINNCKELSILPEDEDRFSRRGRTEYIREKVTELNISSRGSRVDAASIFGPRVFFVWASYWAFHEPPTCWAIRTRQT